MITPIMIDRIGWGTYVFFAAINASFLPFMYLPSLPPSLLLGDYH